MDHGGAERAWRQVWRGGDQKPKVELGDSLTKVVPSIWTELTKWSCVTVWNRQWRRDLEDVGTSSDEGVWELSGTIRD